MPSIEDLWFLDSMNEEFKKKYKKGKDSQQDKSYKEIILNMVNINTKNKETTENVKKRIKRLKILISKYYRKLSNINKPGQILIIGHDNILLALTNGQHLDYL